MLSLHLKKIIPILLIVFAPVGIFPVTILLREGGKVKGDIITQNQHSVLLQTESGKRKVDKDLILKILFQDINDDEEEKIRKEEEDKLAADKKELEDKEAAERHLEEEKQKEEDLKKQAAAEEEARRMEELRKQEAKRPLNALMRSAAVPGWGQYYTDRKFQSILFPTLFAMTAFVAYDKFRVYRTSVKEYGDLGNPYTRESLTLAAIGQAQAAATPSLSPIDAYFANQSSQVQLKRNEADKNFREYQGTLYVLGVIYLINLVDSYFFANSVKSVVQFSDGQSKGMVISAVPSSVGAGSGFSGNGTFSGMETKYTMGYRFDF
ncbi:LA_0442/LA_0875 N-terminal domain-containing protein [Leptospira dzoumogneensis]|uniref:DUF5683 domain-containing protein n=1 Tax=Leptospira dzoumogneensis TaxID=2484904 RepID=A0A4Z1ADL1_9LEPT|nr:DUF5683 domain-containing protein [Leptospira dzoumogneensis]TGN00224.1 hypothetical protein EHR06_08885 [Leptospira dzoumogneensis]